MFFAIFHWRKCFLGRDLSWFFLAKFFGFCVETPLHWFFWWRLLSFWSRFLFKDLLVDVFLQGFFGRYFSAFFWYRFSSDMFWKSFLFRNFCWYFSSASLWRRFYGRFCLVENYLQRCLGIVFASDFVGGFFLDIIGKKISCQRFFCRDLRVEVSLQNLVESFLRFLLGMFF